MAVVPTQTDYDLAQEKVRNVKMKVDLLNFQLQTINSLEGEVISGSITVDATSDIRRTCNITLAIKNADISIAKNGSLWLDKFIKIYVGEDNPRNKGETVWWNMGIFLINNPNTVFDSETRTVTFEGLDLMAKLTGRRNGQLPAMETIVPAGSLITDVVRKIITQFGKFNEYVIEDNKLTVPYDIKKDIGATIYELLDEIRNLYAGWEMYFDVNGVFHWQKIPDGLDDPVIINFDELYEPLIVGENVNMDFENVKNNIIVYGRLLDSGEQVIGRAKDNIDTSPYSINRIGEINYIINDDRIYNNDLANQRAEYELFLHTRMNDSITLTTVPIYWLNDVNIKISYTHSTYGIKGEYLIKTLDIPLDIGSEFTINAIKVYPKEPTV